MRRLLLLPVVATALVLLSFGPARADDKETILADELRLKNAFLDTDGTSLVQFLRTRARGDVAADRLAGLIEALDAKTPAERYKACAELVEIGPPAIPLLRRVARDVDAPETAALARRCLKALEEEPGLLTASVVRLLVARRPAGMAEALLAYLPHAENESVMDELKNALAGVAHEKGKPAAAMLKALADEHPLRRASAIVALCQSGVPEPRDTLRKLLADPMPSVRLRASLALAQASDPKAVSTLILLLAEVPAEQAREVESFLNELAGDQAPKAPAVGSDTVSRERARDVWAKWWLDTEGPGLLNEIKKRTLTEADTARAQALIEKLGDDSFEARQEAENALRKLGSMIIPLLKQATRSADLEIRNRATKCLEAIEMDKMAPLSPVTPRLIALRKPKGAAEAILAYLPFADDESLTDELQAALNAVAFQGGKADPAMIKALTDRQSVRRAAAGQALCSGPLTDYLPQLRTLLRDKDGNVRLKVALALAGAREPEAVPTLITLVGELAPEGSTAAEDYLVKLARDSLPRDMPEGDENRKKRAAAWEKWWTAHKGRVVMVDRFSPVVRERYLGYTLMIQNNNGQLIEWDKDNRQRWAMTGLLNPWDAQWLPGNKILVAEYNGQRVTERDLKGHILWTKQVPSWPLSAERLKNGQTFIVCRNMLLLVDKGGREVLRVDRPNDIMSARRLASGQMVVVTQNRQILRLDRAGKEIKSTTIPAVYGHQNEILDNGNVLMPMAHMNKVAEYNSDGKEVWTCSTMQPMHAQRLANGNTLVMSQNFPYKWYEYDKSGKQVAEVQTNQYAFRLRRR